MKIISWNVNGVNACISKGLIGFMKKEAADAYCFQEMKATKEKMPNIEGYHSYHSIAEKKGYSGVSIFSKIPAINIIEGIENAEFDREGRTITAEFDKFFLINVYFPHAQHELFRLGFKLSFNNSFLEFCNKLSKKKPIIIASDFNVAHKEIDLANPKQNMLNAGFTKEEREWFSMLIGKGYIDTFREFNNEGDNYTWWAYRSQARERNVGWRIDYFVISDSLRPSLVSARILADVYGSDHCPISVELKG